MRKEHFTPPAKWTREFRQALRLSDAHLKVYTYLESAPESHPTGIYFITLAAIAEMTGEERVTVAKIVDDLERCGLVMWDAVASVVWVPCVCGEQYRWTHRPQRKTGEDYRLIEARKHLDDLPPSRLVNLFRQAWPIFGEAPTQAPSQGATQAPYQGANTIYLFPDPPPPPTPGRAANFPPLDENGLDMEGR
ncbi:MAG: hypothetical protein EOM92_20600 [Gammaproteobacteria bacterium]|nr:hypothetical protein [Gammaproteobacteria bacterium]